MGTHGVSSLSPRGVSPAVRFAIAVLLALVLGACTAPAQQAGAGTAQASAAAPWDAPSPAADAQSRRPANPPRMSDPLPPQRLPGAPVAVDRSCGSDADCAVKDVGNCCGYYPACVNKDSPTDPAAVRAQCQKQGMASVCGFRQIAACTCNAGRCEASGAGVPVTQ